MEGMEQNLIHSNLETKSSDDSSRDHKFGGQEGSKEHETTVYET